MKSYLEEKSVSPTCGVVDERRRRAGVHCGDDRPDRREVARHARVLEGAQRGQAGLLLPVRCRLQDLK